MSNRNRRALAWLGFAAIVLLGALYGWFATAEMRRELKDEKPRRDLTELSRMRSRWPDPMVLPPADTPVRIISPFGRFTIPLANIASRDLFMNIPKRPAYFRPQFDGPYSWSSPSVAFWMPDGAGVVTDPDHLLEYHYVDPATLNVRRSPLRPREQGRPDPSLERFVVVAGRFCTREYGPPPPAPHPSWLFPFDPGQGSTLLLTGYSHGARELWSCAVERPPAPWAATSIPGTDRLTMFCRDEAEHCFGWVDLDRWNVRALVYVPRDAVNQMPAVAHLLQTLMQGWQDTD
jgi:hypothetical protein